ncbi:MAG: DnaJ domain-containing protein, partial [archaeon]|nr:DnaJ domain-containing protein [archaeon]
MSSFRENFQREENKETQYDDSAFSTFAVSMLLVGVVFMIILIIRRLLYEQRYIKKEYVNCQCEFCQEKLKKLNQKLKTKNINFSFYLYVIVLLVLLRLTYDSYLDVQRNSGKIKGFNPYEILEIESGADEKTIKKAYKRLALKYHPDKNPNNLQAKAKFILIAKAYDALTNEESRKNFEKWGNPDGPGSMKVSVALPSFVLEKKNHMPILVLFLIFIVFILPGGFLFWYYRKSKFDDSGMVADNKAIFYFFLNENILLKQMPFVLAQAEEYMNLKYHGDEDKLIYKMYMKNKDLMLKHKVEVIPVEKKKAIALLYSYINGTPMNYAKYEDDLKQVLEPVNIFMASMNEICLEIAGIDPQLAKLMKVKPLGYNTMKTIFEFSQNLYQRCNHNQKYYLPFTQLPGFDENKVKNFQRNYRKVFNNKPTCFTDFLEMDKNERDQMLKTEFEEEQVKQINYAIEALPLYDYKMDIFVEDFEDILTEDLVTFKLTITRKNTEEGKILGVNHSCFFPSFFEEKIAIIVLEGKSIIMQEIVDVTSRETIFTFQKSFMDPNLYKYVLEIIPLTYKGMDKKIDLEFNVVNSSEKRKAHLAEIKKREVKKIEPSFFQSMLNQVVPINNDEDEEEEEDENGEEDKKKEKKENKNDDEDSSDEE